VNPSFLLLVIARSICSLYSLASALCNHARPDIEPPIAIPASELIRLPTPAFTSSTELLIAPKLPTTFLSAVFCFIRYACYGCSCVGGSSG